MELTVNRATNLRGNLRVPGDKSISHRAVILGAMAQGKTKIYGLSQAGDVRSTIRCIQALGIEVTDEGDGAVTVTGRGLYGFREPEDVLDAGNSGTTIRLLAGLLSGQSLYVTITGDASLRRRPMGRVTRPLLAMGSRIFGRAGGELAPVTILGGKLAGTEHELPVASAQVKSALLLAGLYARGRTTVTEPYLSRDHTERMLAAFGVPVRRQGLTVSVDGGAELQPQEVFVPGDISSAAFFLVAASLVPEAEVRIEGVGVNPTRTGIIDALQRMGADITLENETTASGEPVADLVVRSGRRLKGISLGGAEIPRMIDEIPVLAVAATQAEGETVIRDAAELKVKESNRLHTVAVELQRLGAEVHELDDGLVIKGPARLAGARCASYGDHRIAMALSVAGLVAEGQTTITGSECIDISFPGFEERLRQLLS